MIPVVRRWAVDWLASHDPSVCVELLSDDYTLVIGALTLEGRDPYVEGTMGQLKIFPGLCLTVHEILSNGRFAAIRFTEHGAAAHRAGRLAAWRGIALFEQSEGQLVRSWAQEDYLARQRQLADGVADAVEAPHVAPWDVAEQAHDSGAADTVRAWLEEGLRQREGVAIDDGRLENLDTDLTIDQVDVIVSAGPSVAFHARQPPGPGGFARGVAGFVHVENGHISGHVVTDRHGARRALRDG